MLKRAVNDFPRHAQIAFQKLMALAVPGDPDLQAAAPPQQQKPAFVEFLKSVQFGAPTAAPAAMDMSQLPPSHPPIGGMNSNLSTPGADVGDKPAWTVPAGWQEGPLAQFLTAKYVIAGNDGAEASVNVSSLAGDGGGLLPNVNRWRAQLGLAPETEASLANSATITASGGTATLVPLSLTDFDGVARLGAALHERHGRIDILVGNAGVAATSSPLGHTDLKPWIDMMAVNVTANFQLIRCMEPLLKQSDAGRAVFVTSGAAHKALAYMGPYAASKAALDTLVRVWANETASTNLRVNLFSPGPIRTRMRASVFPGEDPMTLDTPEQVAEFIVAMCVPTWTETGKLYDYATRTLMSFRPPA